MEKEAMKNINCNDGNTGDERESWGRANLRNKSTL